MKILQCRKKTSGEIFEISESAFPDPNASEWRGVTVFGEFLPDGTLPSAVMELLGKARQEADRTDDKAQLLLIGSGLVRTARKYFSNGADRVFVYDDPALAVPDSDRYDLVLDHFAENFKPAAIYFFDSQLSRELSGRLKARIVSAGTLPAAGSSYEESLIAPAPNPARRGELVICEIPEAVQPVRG